MSAVPIPAFAEKRAVSLVVDTATVLPGTLLNVPSALPTGPVPDKPVVAVNTQRWYTSFQFWGTLVGFPVVDAVAEYVLAGGTLDSKHVGHVALSACLGAWMAYRRKTSNTVLN